MNSAFVSGHRYRLDLRVGLEINFGFSDGVEINLFFVWEIEVDLVHFVFMYGSKLTWLKCGHRD